MAADFKFDASMSRVVLESYLCHNMCMSHFSEISSGQQREDDIRMIKNIGAKLIIRAAIRWYTYPDVEVHFNGAQTLANELHQVDPEIILQGAIFEVVGPDANNVPIPAWVFQEFGLPVVRRNFIRSNILYDVPWGLHDGAAPDITKIETQMWFYYWARRYLDAGFEAIHFGQLEHICRNDFVSECSNLLSVLTRIRNYAAAHARKRFILCDAYTYGVNRNGKLLFDYHTWPTRPQEVVSSPQEAILVMGWQDAIWGKSKGGVTPSGWSCQNLPYLAEIDNGFVDCTKVGTPSGWPYVWHYDEISWFAHQTEDYRNQ